MRFQTGKFAGKTTQEVLLKFPDWARWNVKNFLDVKHSKHFGELAKKFTSKPFVERCEGCNSEASYASAYRGSPSLRFWCDNCSPTQTGAEPAKLSRVKSMRDVLMHIEVTANGNRNWQRQIVRALAEAKGLPKRVGEKQAVAFFSTST
ncbi:hypothetical protein ACYCVF_07495 [Bradyrhizobium sp. 1.29L]